MKMLNGSNRNNVPLEQVWEQEKAEDLKKAPQKSQKRKSPGIDKFLNFWLNAFNSIHRNITNCFNRAIKNPEMNPKWFTQGITYLLPKQIEANKPKYGRPIKCLCTKF